MARKKQNEQGLIVQPTTAAAILQIQEWVVQGQRAADILESIGTTYPNERPDVLLSQALAEIADEAENIDANLARGFLLSAYRELYRRAAEVNDFGAALSALRAFERQIT